MSDTKYPTPTLENIASLENLYMAWNRLAKSITYSDVWYDEYEFSKFECLLDKNIHAIHKALLDGSYRMDSIRPIPFPKGGRDDSGNLKVRQAFWISMKDQLVWVAICNVLGPLIETKMPGWSTGNRLYVPMWKENGDEKSQWQYGSFLNCYPFIYRKWKQGWPKYRKVLTASIKRMAIGKCKEKDCPDILDDTDETEITENTGMPGWLNVRYLTDNYFKGKKFQPKLYWGGIDLKTFYPTIDSKLLIDDLIRFAPINEDATKRLINTMFEFEVDKSGYSEQELADMGFEKDISIGLPTGLIVGGWLANVYLLEIDNKIESKLKSNDKVIHFRYVDDHTFVAETFEILIDWMHEYWLLLKERNLKINFDKIQPALPESYPKVFSRLIEDGWECLDDEEIKKDLARIELHSKEEVINGIGAYCSIDPIYPSPLMTLTLQKVSQISHLSLNLLSKSENDLIFHDLKSLITVDLPEAEIKKETRISFASTMLSRMLLSNPIDLEKIRHLRETFIRSHSMEKFSIEKRVGDGKVGVLSEGDSMAIAIESKIESENIDRCLSFAFDDLECEPGNELKSLFPKLDWQSLEEIRKCVDNSRKDSRRRANKIFYLLRRALDEAPDKVNIWIRTMEFCIRHSPAHIPELFDYLGRISDKTLHGLGVNFIRRQLLSLCAVWFIKAVWEGYEGKLSNVHFGKNSYEFIAVMMNLPDYDETYYFNHGTFRLLKLARSFNNLLADGDQTDIETYLNDSDFNDASFSLMYLVNLAENRISPKVIFDVFQSLFTLVKNKDEYTGPLILKLFDICRDLKKETIQTIESFIDSSDCQLVRDVYDCAYKPSSEAVTDGWISIRNLLRSEEWVTSKFGKSEYVCAKILCDVITYITGSNEILANLVSCDFNTSNLLLRKEETDKLDWHDIIANRTRLTVRYDPESETELMKSLNKPPMPNAVDYESRIIFGVGTVFYHLLCGRQTDDWQKLYRETGYSWRSRINSLVCSGKICTASKKILSGCLLPYVWETRRINGTVSSRNKAIAIDRIVDLESRIIELKETLKRNIVLKSLGTDSLVGFNGADNPNETGYGVVEFKIIKVD